MSTPVVLRPTRSGGTSPASTIASEIRRFSSAAGEHVFVTDGSRIYDLTEEYAATIDGWCRDGGLSIDAVAGDQLAADLGLTTDPGARYIGTAALQPPPLASISLNVMQACNMSCGYCYADEGRFGGSARRMTLDVAKRTVDRLIAEAEPGTDLVVGFMGGEPLLNRRVVHAATRYAARAGAESGHRMRFSLTTNLTLLRPQDARLFAEFPFTVAASIDGDAPQNDTLRRMKDGTGAYIRVVEGLALMARHGRPAHLAARVTVTPRTADLPYVLDHLIGLGFDDVGFAPVLVSPDPGLALTEDDFTTFLDGMTTCGRKALGELEAGRSYPFGNLETALQQIHRGTHRPLPCGAGAAYLSANAEGDLFACHRLIDDPAYAMGSVGGGSDHVRRATHLARNHVDTMAPCRGCWARYLCGGGCYHEVSRRGRIACDYIRGWLDFCLQAYVELSASRPAYFLEKATA